MKPVFLLKSTFFILIVLSTSCQSDEGWTPLFNGENMDGWHVYGGDENFNGWYVEGDVLVFDPAQRSEAKSSNIITDTQYENFELSLDWMISENGNSGLFWAVVESDAYEQPYHTGPEIQILDDGWTEYVEERGDINRAGSLYNLMPPSSIVSKPAGEWNNYLLHIDHQKNEGWLTFNGTRVLEFPVHGPAWQQLIDNSNFADWQGFGEAQKGHIGLQEHGGKVAFRNIKIRELK